MAVTTQDNGSQQVVDRQKENTQQLVESIEKLNSSINKLDKGTTNYNKRLLGISFIMFAVALMQLFIAAWGATNNFFINIFIMILMSAILIFFINDAFKDM